MIKFWHVVVHEYTRHVFRWRFIFTLLSLPAFMAVALFVVILIVRLGQDQGPIGYVDHSGLLASTSGSSPQILRFDTETEAEAALTAKQIQAYYVLEEDYIQSSQVRFVALKPPGIGAHSQFENMVRAKLLAGQPPEIVQRLNQGNQLIVRTVDGSRQFSEQDKIKLFTPLLAFFVFILAILSTSGYLMQAMTEEKENRTMEVIITSLSPSKMMAGKITAIVAIGITQLLVWFGLILLGISIWGESNNSMRDINIPIGMAALMVVTLLLAFVMISAIIAAVGAIVTEATEGQQITGPFSIPFIIPYLFAFQILNDPNSSLAVIMTFVPFTAPVTLIMRTSLAVIPTWQILLSLLIQITCVLFLVWLAGRAFRVGMLQYRRHLTWREIFNRSG